MIKAQYQTGKRVLNGVIVLLVIIILLLVVSIMNRTNVTMLLIDSITMSMLFIMLLILALFDKLLDITYNQTIIYERIKKNE